MESALDQMMMIVEMTKEGETIPKIQKRIRESFKDPLSRKRVSEIVKNQRREVSKGRKPLDHAKSIVREDPDISVQELKVATSLSLSTCYKVLREVTGRRKEKTPKNCAKKKRAVRALPNPDLKYDFDPPCIPASKNWPKWLIGEEESSTEVKDEVKLEQNDEVNIETAQKGYECNPSGSTDEQTQIDSNNNFFRYDHFGLEFEPKYFQMIEHHIMMKVQEYEKEEEDEVNSCIREQLIKIEETEGINRFLSDEKEIYEKKVFWNI